MDFGVKKSFIDALAKRDCTVTVYPAGTGAAEILADAPDGILITNGPCDPKSYTAETDEIKKLFDAGVPMFGIALGHQLIALANGGSTEKMPYGNRGANQPVRFLDDDNTYLTSQNHGYAVTDIPANAEVSSVNVNDQSIEVLFTQTSPFSRYSSIPTATRVREVLHSYLINS